MMHVIKLGSLFDQAVIDRSLSESAIKVAQIIAATGRKKIPLVDLLEKLQEIPRYATALCDLRRANYLAMYAPDGRFLPVGDNS